MTIRLYGFWRSIATYRVRVALRLKGLEFEEVPVDILSGSQFDAAFDTLNPGHAVPTLVHGGVTLSQSLAILEYLEEVVPVPALLPTGAADRAAARAFALVTIADAHPLIVPRVRKALAQDLAATPAQVDAWARHWIAEGLATYERLLDRHPPSPFCFGETPGIADIALMGHVASAELFAIDLATYPNVAELARLCGAVGAFAESHPRRQAGAPA
jgi:maleylpyruvate isomerase